MCRASTTHLLNIPLLRVEVLLDDERVELLVFSKACSNVRGCGPELMGYPSVVVWHGITRIDYTINCTRLRRLKWGPSRGVTSSFDKDGRVGGLYQTN